MSQGTQQAAATSAGEQGLSGPIVQFIGATKKIGKRTIVDHLTLEVPPGEVFGFLGPNGAGKTTTIRMMVGLIRISEGDIRIKGHSVRQNFEQAIAHVGAIVENPEMYKHLTGYQNLLHFARMTPGVTRERIDEVIELVGMGARIKDKVKVYSLGMRQRLGVAQALLHRPSLLILDEPTNGLDPAGIRELRDYLRRLSREEGITVFVSSHLLSEMELLCDRVAIIQNGKLIDVQKVIRETEDGERGEDGNTEADAALLTVHFDTDQKETALHLLQDGGCAATLLGNRVVASLSREQIAAVNARLVGAGVKVYGIRAVNKSLEDTFLEKTGGEGIG